MGFLDTISSAGEFLASIPVDAAKSIIRAPQLMYSYASGERLDGIEAQCERNARAFKLSARLQGKPPPKFSVANCKAKRIGTDIWNMTGAPALGVATFGMAPGMKGLNMGWRAIGPMMGADFGVNTWMAPDLDTDADVNAFLKKYDRLKYTDTKQNIQMKRMMGVNEKMARSNTFNVTPGQFLMELGDRAGTGGVTAKSKPAGMRSGGRVRAQAREQARGNNTRTTRGRSAGYFRGAERDLQALQNIEEQFAPEQDSWLGVSEKERNEIRKRALEENYEARESIKAALRERLADLNDVEGLIAVYAVLNKKTRGKTASAKEVESWLNKNGITNIPSRARTTEIIHAALNPPKKDQPSWWSKKQNVKWLVGMLSLMGSGTIAFINRWGLFSNFDQEFGPVIDDFLNFARGESEFWVQEAADLMSSLLYAPPMDQDVTNTIREEDIAQVRANALNLVATYRQQIAVGQQQLEAAQQRISALENEENALRQLAEQRAAQIASLEQRSLSATGQAMQTNEYRRKLRRTENAYHALAQEKQALAEELNTVKAELARLEKQSADDIEAMSASAAEAAQLMADREQQIANLTAQVANAEQNLKATEQVLASAEANARSLGVEVGSLRQQVGDRDKRIRMQDFLLNYIPLTAKKRRAEYDFRGRPAKAVRYFDPVRQSDFYQAPVEEAAERATITEIGPLALQDAE